MLIKRQALILIMMLGLFFVKSSSAQKVAVINQKGTKASVNNNTVFTTNNTAPTSAYLGDIWLNTKVTPPLKSIYDGTSWISLETIGTKGSVFFAGDDGRPTDNNVQLSWNNSDEQLNVGIPITSSVNKLSVNGSTRTSGLTNSRGTAGLPSYRFSDDSSTGMFSTASGLLQFSTAGIEALNISASQQVNVLKNVRLGGALLDGSNSAGTAGQVLSSTGATTGTVWVDPKLVSVVNKTTSYTLFAADNGKVFTFNSGTAMTLTVPTGLPVGFNISIYQTGLGEVTIIGGATILNRLSRFKTAGKDAGVGLLITATNTAHLTGDLKK
ncbi:hypothetical protein [Flavobacterium frigidarium]|uniref:hypothetical protein n=1 Tax=Flavobacterium frigidarium TaxID=99286 RepID=UPI0003FD0313|nr:hypothetical protein [Flavobacterium frigidarium]